MTQPDHDIDATLRAALVTAPLSERRLERLRANVAQEWRAATAPQPARPSAPLRLRRIVYAVAATVAFATLLLPWIRSAGDSVSIGSVSRLPGGSLQVSSGIFRRRTVVVGEPLNVGDRLTTRGPALVTLTGGGTLRMSTDTTLSITAPTHLTLDRGLVYLDLPHRPTTSNPLLVLTRAGTVEHVGTEFEVLSDPQRVRIRVREGRIRFTGTASSAGSAGSVDADAGTELLASPGSTLQRRPVATSGHDWSWETALAPDYELEGRSLMEFLIWESRELGCRLDFAESQARIIADRTQLHGAIRDQSPADALSNVLATTTLSFKLLGDTIRIQSNP